MKINFNDYSYSNANAVGMALRQPLFKLVANIAIAATPKPWEPAAAVIGRVALHCLLAAVLFVPVGMAWLAGKAICVLSKTQVDLESLALVPPKIEIPQEAAADADIDIRTLSERFNALNAPDTRSADQTPKQQSFARLCNWIAEENDNIYPDNPEKRHQFCKEVSLYLKGVMKKLEPGTDKERDVLLELAEASTRCYPTWLEASSRMYAEVSGQSETVQVKLLRYIQEYKEALILEFSQTEVGAQWHALNFIRNILGHDLGLNTELNQFDPYAGLEDRVFGKGLSKWLFMQRYDDVNRLVANLETVINARSYDRSYHDFLLSIVKELGVEKTEDYVAEHFFTEDYKLKAVAINMMLKSMAILK